MYTNLYVYRAPRLYMSGKLYWRIKKDGKWTWKPVEVISQTKGLVNLHIEIKEEEE